MPLFIFFLLFPLLVQAGEPFAFWHDGNGNDENSVLEVYLQNDTQSPVEFTRAWLNGKEVKSQDNGIVWTQFYPSAKCEPGQTVAFQACHRDNPWYKKYTLEFERSDGKRITVKIPEFQYPGTKIAAVTFSRDYKKVHIAYSSFQIVQPPKQVWINGQELTDSMNVVAEPQKLEGSMFRGEVYWPCGLAVVTLPKPLKLGDTVSVRMIMENGLELQGILRASSGVYVDAFGISEQDVKLRKELGLDLRPYSQLVDIDVSCMDGMAGKPGMKSPEVLKVAQGRYASGDDRLRHCYLCTAARGHVEHPIYGYLLDAGQVLGYNIAWSQNPKFITDEENRWNWIRRSANPRPWFYITECFTYQDRMIEPAELRMCVYGALGKGCKGIDYFIWKGNNGLKGFSESPLLIEEIKKLNREINILEPLLAPAVWNRQEICGDDKTGVEVDTLWSGEEGAVVIVRNLDYTIGRKPNDMGRKPQLKLNVKKDVTVTFTKPVWINPLKDNQGRILLIDPLTLEKFPAEERDGKLFLTLPTLDTARVFWIKNIKK